MVDAQALATLIDQLLAGWVDFVSDDGPALTEWRKRTDTQVVIIMTLTAHVHQTARILRPVLPSDLTIAHMPLVRSIFESTMTLVWCDEVADGAHALINDGARQRRALRDTLAGTASMQEFAQQISVGMGSLPTSSEQQGRKMQLRCADIALDGAYAYYRMLSGLSHASIDTVDAYLDADTFRAGEPISVKSNSGPLTTSFSWSHLIASCLVWSGMVTNYLDPSRSRRNDLRSVARALQIEDELPITYSAHQRGSSR